MSPAEQRFWQRVNRRAASLTPEMNAAIVKAFENIRASVSDAEFLALVNSRASDALIDDVFNDVKLDRAFQPARQELRSVVEKSFQHFTNGLPARGHIDGQLAVMFDTLNPKVIAGIRELESRVINTLKDTIRETVRAHVEKGLRDGVPPREVARGLRATIGLAPNQAEAVRNFERGLRGAEGSTNPIEYKMRDRRFDGAIAKGELSEEQIGKMTDAYRRRMTAHHANTVSGTATKDALKLGQQLTMADAVDKGIYDPAHLTKTWIGVMDDRERAEHVAMEKQTVPWDAYYSNGDYVPGESTWNCRCVSIFRQAA